MRQKAGIAVITLLIIAFACVLLYRHQREFGINCADDAYISFRYAKNLAGGKGLVFNVGERVEGFSNPLWTFMLAICAAIGYELEPAARALGSFFSYVALVLSILLAKRLSKSNIVAPVAAALMLTGSTSFLLYSTSGLETAQYAIILSLCAYLATFKSPTARSLAIIFGSLAALSRPEGVLVTLVLWAMSILWLFMSDKSQRIKIGIGLILSVIIFLGFFIFRYFYFGDIYPNTYYAKPANWLKGVESLSDLRKNMLNTSTGFHGGLVLAILIIGASAVSLSAGWIVTAGVILSGLIFLYYAGYDWMPFARFFAPYHPVFCAASVASIFVLIDKGLAPARSFSATNDVDGRALSLWHKLVCVVLALMIGFLPQIFFELDVKRFASKASKLPYHVVNGRFVKYVAKELSKLIDSVEPYSISIATKRVGAVGYFCPVKIDDLYGLVDKSVAQIYHKHRNSKDSSARDKEVATLILARNPEMVLIFSESPFKNPSDPYQSKDLNKLESIQRQVLKAALAKRYYFERGFHKGDLSAYLYLRPDFTLGSSAGIKSQQ